MSVASELAALFQRDLTRLWEQVAAFPNEGALWQRSAMSNAAGNLVLHLEGNLREYVGRQMGGVAYKRDRPQEFARTGVAAAELGERIVAVRELVRRVVGGLTEEELGATHPEDALGTPLTTRALLIHLHGHLNYHLGQVDALRRELTGGGAIAYTGLEAAGGPE